jgi:hypothetical protein
VLFKYQRGIRSQRNQCLVEAPCIHPDLVEDNAEMDKFVPHTVFFWMCIITSVVQPFQCSPPVIFEQSNGHNLSRESHISQVVRVSNLSSVHCSFQSSDTITIFGAMQSDRSIFIQQSTTQWGRYNCNRSKFGNSTIQRYTR